MRGLVRNHLADIEIEAYRTRTTSPEQFVAISNHIYECDQCFRRCDSPQKLRATYDAMKKFLNEQEVHWTEHLDYEQLAEFTNGTLDDETKASVLAHAEHCPECNLELKEFAALKAQCDLEIKNQAGPRKRKNLITLWKKPGSRRAYGVVFFILVTTLVIWTYERRNLRIASLEKTVAQLTQENNDLRKRADGLPLVLNDGSRHISFDERGEPLGLVGLSAPYRDAVKEALTTGSVATPPPPETILGKIGIRLGVTAQERSSDPLYPVATTVESTRPGFEWQSLPGARSYTVLLRDLATGEETEGKPTGKTTWIPDVELARGHQYAWMVETRVGGQYVRIPSSDKPFAAFRVLDVQQAQEVSLARNSWGNSHLVMGLVYAKAGLVSEAEREFKELLAANPESSMAKSLLASVDAKTTSGRRK